MQIVTRLIASAAVFFLCSSFAAKEKTTLTIIVTDLRNNKGTVLVSVYNDASKFPKDAAKYAIAKSAVPIVNRAATASFPDLPYGKYAVAVLHDENNDLQMNTNLVGMPKEGFGFSNDARGTFGPPAFSKAAFNISSKETAITIKLSYFL